MSSGGNSTATSEGYRKKLKSDPTAQLAIRLGRELGRHDWWNLYLEHTPAEWAAQVAAASVVPLRDERDDIRMALSTLTTVQSNSTKPLSDSRSLAIVRSLTSYMDPKPSKPLSPAETKRMLGGG